MFLFSCLQKPTSCFLCQHWEFIVLAKWTLYIFRQRDEFQGISGKKYLADYPEAFVLSVWSGDSSSSSSIIWGTFEKYTFSGSTQDPLNHPLWGWHPAQASESLPVGGASKSAGKVSGKERQYDHRCVAYLKHFMKRMWRPTSKAFSSVTHPLTALMKTKPYFLYSTAPKISRIGIGVVSYSACFPSPPAVSGLSLRDWHV